MDQEVIANYDGPARGVNQQNAFEQQHDQVHQHFRKDIPGLVYVNLYEFPNGSLYKGQMLVNREKGTEERCGFGIQKWVDGAVYEGYWLNNKAEGKGTFWHAEGDIYIGEFRADQAYGYGVYTHVNGSRYEGKWVNDIQQGHGEETWADGARYNGSYVNGMKNG